MNDNLNNKSSSDQVDVNTSDEKNKEKTNKFSKFLSSRKFVIVVDVFVLAILIYVLYKLPQSAEGVKNIRNQILNANEIPSSQLIEAELSSVSDTWQKVSILLPDESGLIDFVSLIEEIKTDGVLYDFYFANEVPVKDKSGQLGFPFVLQFEGTWEQINGVLLIIQKSPYLTRNIRIEARINNEVVKAKYGGIIYVSNEFGK